MIELKADLNTKLGSHAGIFSISYQIERAKYDARRKNWQVGFKNDCFVAIDSDNKANYISFTKSIFNCSCKEFVENQSGTCQHIEAVKLARKENYVQFGDILKQLKTQQINYINFQYDEPYVDGYQENSPAVKNYLNYINSIKIDYNNNKYEDINVFPGIEWRDYQDFSIREMIRKKRTVLTLKMGLGKTLCAMACAKLLKTKKNIIVCPNGLKYQWYDEIKKHNLGSAIVINKKEDVHYYDEEEFLIVNYEFLNFHPYILGDKFDLAIIDEIQKIKNKDSVTWSNIAEIQSEYIMALSGTVIQNTVSDLVSVIKILNQNEFTPEWKFYSEYCETTKAKVLGFHKDKLPDLIKRVERYIINPTIDYSKFKLPKPHYINVNVKLDNAQLQLSNNYYNMAQKLLAKSMNTPLTFAEKSQLNVMLTKARMGALDGRLLDDKADKSVRIEKIEEIIKEVTSTTKLLIYSDWIQSLALLKEFLDKNQIKYVDYNGELNIKKRDKNLKSFINDPTIKVMLSTDSGGVGLDGFQFSCYNVLHMEPTWNPAKISQRNGRLIRMFQKNEVVDVYSVVSNASIEEMVLDGNARKISLFNSIFS